MKKELTTKDIQNAFTVDVEDYFHVAALSRSISVSDWDSYECRVEVNTHKILAILNERKQNATFFVLGWIAKRYPKLVREIAELGHEVASHGMSHQLIYNQSPDVFKRETFESKALLEDIVNKPVLGYRAATYSITNESLWALDILVDAGYKYDSSIFPMKHDKYGISDINPLPHVLSTPKGRTIVEFPISTLKKGYFTLPIAGGGYFRLFPYALTKWALKKINQMGTPFVFYIHPWEVDPEQPKVSGITKFSKFRHYNNLENCEQRLKNLSESFLFSSMQNVLKHLSLL